MLIYMNALFFMRLTGLLFIRRLLTLRIFHSSQHPPEFPTSLWQFTRCNTWFSYPSSSHYATLLRVPLLKQPSDSPLTPQPQLLAPPHYGLLHARLPHPPDDLRAIRVGIFTDAALFVVPVAFTWRTLSCDTMRVRVTIPLSVGLLTCVAAATRVYMMSQQAQTKDPSVCIPASFDVT